MTDKEKAKAYDKVIKRAKQLYVDGMPQISRNTIEYIFPELKESENERIRKEIIDHINNMKAATISDLKEKQFESWIAWLEKQKYAITCSEEQMKEAGYKWDTEKKELKKIENRPMLSDFFKAEYERGKADAISEVQKEWSEEDENTIKVLMNIIRKSEMIDSIIYTDSLKEKLYDWLKSLKQRIGR